MTAEDLALDRMLEQAAAEEPAVSDNAPIRAMTLENSENTPLSLFMQVEPAKTHADLMEQVHLAKQHGADSVEAAPDVIKAITRKSGYPEDVGYLWFHDVKVWIPGFMDSHGHLLSETIEHKLFKNSKVTIAAVEEPTGGKR